MNLQNLEQNLVSKLKHTQSMHNTVFKQFKEIMKFRNTRAQELFTQISTKIHHKRARVPKQVMPYKLILQNSKWKKSKKLVQRENRSSYRPYIPSPKPQPKGLKDRLSKSQDPLTYKSNIGKNLDLDLFASDYDIKSRFELSQHARYLMTKAQIRRTVKNRN